MSLHDLLELTIYFCFLSLLTVGGGLTVSSDMNRFLVSEKGYLTHSQFTESIALAQAAPGPNILFVAVLGWEAAGLPGAILLQIAIVLPSSLLAYHANRWRTGNLQSRLVRAARTGLSPLAIGFTLSGGWVVAWGAVVGEGVLGGLPAQIGMGVLTAVTLALALITKMNPLWLIALGGVVGVLIL
jgi:chromate transporter